MLISATTASSSICLKSRIRGFWRSRRRPPSGLVSPSSIATPAMAGSRLFSPSSSRSMPSMADLFIVYWRDIPAQVIAKKGRVTAKRQLSERFEKAIDRAAMRAKLRDTDSYLAEWRRAEPVPCGDDLEAEDTAAAERLETEWTEERLAKAVAAGGVEAQEGFSV